MKRTSVACSIEWISFRDSSALGSLGQELKLLIGWFPNCLGHRAYRATRSHVSCTMCPPLGIGESGVNLLVGCGHGSKEIAVVRRLAATGVSVDG